MVVSEATVLTLVVAVIMVALATAEPVGAVVVKGSLDRQREEKFPRRT